VALAKGYPGRVFFELEEAREASRWNTLRALRVLRWTGSLDVDFVKNDMVLKKSANLT
jgi:hypothetical protein